MNAIDHRPIIKALELLQVLSDDEETQHRAMLRERALRDEMAFRRDALHEGRVSLLTSMLQHKFGPLPEAAEKRLQAATKVQVQRWSERILTAGTLEEVLA